MQGLKILGTGSYTPELTVTNDDMAKIVDTNDEWIKTRTGMSVRHYNNGEPSWYMGAMASKQAIETAGISPEDIGLIIDTTITPDFHTPSTACMIQREIGAIGSIAMDVNAACSGFVYGFDMARRYLMTDENIKYALVVANEDLTKLVDFQDRGSCILFGDGAAAVIVELSEGMFTSFIGADGNGTKYLFARAAVPQNPFITDRKKYSDGMPEGREQYLYQDGREVYKFATKALPNATLKAAEKIGLNIDDVDVFIPHQANIRIIETAAKNMGVSMDKFFVNLHEHGNTSSASIPIALDDAIRTGRVKRGDKVCLVGFGAGLTYAAAIFEY